jgi:hypothetical protein
MTTTTIIGWGVYYAPTEQARLFAGLKQELQDCFKNQSDALKFKNHLNMGGSLDDLHSGYVVYSLRWLPKGFQLK